MSSEGRLDDLATWAADLVGEPIEAIDRRPGGGRHEAWDVRGRDGMTWFLRADSSPPDDFEHYTLRREAEIYRAVDELGIPTASILGVHPVHEAVLMEYVPGVARIADLDRDAQLGIVDDFAPILARLHAADPSAMALPSLHPVRSVSDHVVEELDIWERRLDASGVPDPFLTACFAWLRGHVPDVAGPPSLVQGDTGPGNFLHDGTRVTAMLDLELAHLGDPMEDLAWVGTRNSQEPVPDFERFLAHYSSAGGAPFDIGRFRYHSLFAELRIAVLGAGRAGVVPHPMADLGNGLIYGVLHRRLTVEAFAAAAGVTLPDVELPRSADTASTGSFDGVLAQLKNIVGPAVDDAFASQRLKSVARMIKYLREVDRVGDAHLEAELSELAKLLGSRTQSAEAGRAQLDEMVRSGELTAVDLLPMAAADAARRQQLAGPAMGVLASRHLPIVT